MIRFIFIFFLAANGLAAQNFRVQICAFADTVPSSYFRDQGIFNVIVSYDYMGIYHYYTGSFRTREDAEVLLPILKSKGYPGATIIDLEEQRVLSESQCPYIRLGQPLKVDTAIVRVIKFDAGSMNLNQDAQKELLRIAEYMKDRPLWIANLKSYTDSQGDAMSNIELATVRARKARDFLIDHGVRADRMFIKIYGEADPLVDNQDLYGRDVPEMQKHNRRIEFELYNKKN